ncbi:MAG: sigma-54-dependent transcriptional regulator [Calditrichia bacterium]
MKKLLIIEDNDTMRLGMTESLRRDGYMVLEFANPKEGLDYFLQHPCQLVLTDLKMEPIDGIEVLRTIREQHPSTEVLLVSAFGTVDTAVQAMKLGASDFLTKPFSMEELRVRVANVWQRIAQRNALNQLTEEKRLLQEELFADMIGSSEPMQRIFSMIQRVAPQDSTVLIEGESGTGKELVAQAIHRQSLRKERPFIKLNCAALNDNLLESELFGHEKGAFTGALRQKRGRFELADGGSLFLDEIGDISPAMQVRLLRVLQEGEFERLGGEATISVDVRIICATHQNLAQKVESGEFREDLFYRLNVIPIKLPALRERKDDIPLLVAHFVKKRNATTRSFSADAIKQFMNYSWPGNIRELENLVERLIVIAPNDEIDAGTVGAQLGNSPVQGMENFSNLPLEDAVAAFEKSLIVHALKSCEGVKNRAAKMLGIKTSTLYYKLEKYGL